MSEKLSTLRYKLPDSTAERLLRTKPGRMMMLLEEIIYHGFEDSDSDTKTATKYWRTRREFKERCSGEAVKTDDLLRQIHEYLELEAFREILK